ncbi:MAG: carboxy terminal-processing peptidase, partial [Wenzhouxiangellaceae bacterium]
IGVIDVPVFYVDFRGRARNEPNYRSSTRDVRRLINELRGEGINGLVIDLRGNGGGALVEATTMTGLFIDEGPVVQVRDSSGRLSIESDNEPGMAWDGPLAVLVDRGSASASEIFAAAIQDYGRGIIIGESTFGKGTVQNLFNLDNYVTDDDKKLGQIKLTMAKFFRINGGSTQLRGVEPDVALPSYNASDDYGESALDFAMAWSQIDALDYHPVADLSPLLPDMRERHLQRRAGDEFASLLEDYEHWQKMEQRTSVSLLETARREEQEKAEQRRARRFGNAGDEPESDADSDPAAEDAGDAIAGVEGEDDAAADEQQDEPDVLRTEAARILADLIELHGDAHRMAQAPGPGIELEGSLN